MAEFFNLVGKLSIGKETEKFTPISKNTYDSGWMRTRVLFNCISDVNRIPLVAEAGRWVDDKKNNPIKTFSKNTTNADGTTTKGTKIDVAFDKRFDKEEIAKIAGFRKFVIDTGNNSQRYKLMDAVKAFEDGDITDELKEEVGVSTLEEAKAALAKSEAKKKEFIFEHDFVEHLIKVLKSDKFKDTLWNISGQLDVSYNPNKGTFYKSYKVNRITLAREDSEPVAELKLDLFFGENAFNADDYEETSKATISGFVKYYDNSVKANGFAPVVVAVREDEKKMKALQKKFVVEDGEVRNIGMTVSIIEGAQRVPVTREMLDEETLEDLDAGLIEWDDIVRQYGNNVVGERISELRYDKLNADKRTAQVTAYSIEDLVPAIAQTEESDEDDEEDDNSVPFDVDEDEDDL